MNNLPKVVAQQCPSGSQTPLCYVAGSTSDKRLYTNLASRRTVSNYLSHNAELLGQRGRRGAGCGPRNVNFVRTAAALFNVRL